MSDPSSTSRSVLPPLVRDGVIRRWFTVGSTLVAQAALLFGGAGRLDWLWAWVYVGVTAASGLLNGLILLRANPETVAERGHLKHVIGWDKAFSAVWMAMHFAFPLAAGLDARWGWSRPLGATWHVAATAVYLAGIELTVWAMLANAYFSCTVRIQSERGHAVCRGGPYRLVRHPGYVGYLVQFSAIPVLLGTWWALLPALVAMAAIVARTALEDRLLRAELPGYREYAQDVRYRLLPGIW